MTDTLFNQLIIYAIVVIGAYYHGYKIGITAGAGKMYDFLFEKAVRKGNYKIAKFKIEDDKAPEL